MKNIFRTCYFYLWRDKHIIDHHTVWSRDPVASCHDWRDESKSFVHHAVEMRKRGEGVCVAWIDAVYFSLQLFRVFGVFREEPPDTDKNSTRRVADE